VRDNGRDNCRGESIALDAAALRLDSEIERDVGRDTKLDGMGRRFLPRSFRRGHRHLGFVGRPLETSTGVPSRLSRRWSSGIESEHAAYLARSIPNASLNILPDVSHFAPLQRPEQFNAELNEFLGTVART
jgi:pimeloyl-ACP methyl ester carboxylesterase